LASRRGGHDHEIPGRSGAFPPVAAAGQARLAAPRGGARETPGQCRADLDRPRSPQPCLDLDLVEPSRAQLALAVMFHHLFPPLSIGLGPRW
jgi:hypothetical protein